MSILLISLLSPVSAWTFCSPIKNVAHEKSRTALMAAGARHDAPWSLPAKTAAAAALCSLLITTNPATAYDTGDYASETVTGAVQTLADAKDTDSIVKAYENMAEIITEGKGVGGQINFQGVQLDRGYIADEDTTLYNPGLTLLTESEKERLVESIVKSKQTASSWNVDTQAGYDFLRDKLDPLHMYELRGYLSIVPFFGAAVYVGVLAVQQFARDLFPVAYIAGALLVFGPAIALVLLGPQ